jgi:hypothetical protein
VCCGGPTVASGTFENRPAAERFKTLLEDQGPDEALRIVELDEIGRHVPTVSEWLHAHIDSLTGVQSATLALYRSYGARDVDPVFGSMPVSAVNETTIALWVKQLGGVQCRGACRGDGLQSPTIRPVQEVAVTPGLSNDVHTTRVARAARIP